VTGNRLAHLAVMHERPCHYTAKRGSDATVFGTQVRSVQAFFLGMSECCVDYDVNHAGQ